MCKLTQNQIINEYIENSNTMSEKEEKNLFAEYFELKNKPNIIPENINNGAPKLLPFITDEIITIISIINNKDI